MFGRRGRLSGRVLIGWGKSGSARTVGGGEADMSVLLPLREKVAEPSEVG